MDQQAQRGGQDVRQVVEELHIHHHGLVSHDERPVVAHETHHKHHFIDQLQEDREHTENGAGW